MEALQYSRRLERDHVDAARHAAQEGRQLIKCGFFSKLDSYFMFPFTGGTAGALKYSETVNICCLKSCFAVVFL